MSCDQVGRKTVYRTNSGDKPISVIDSTAYIHPQTSVTGDVIINANVMVASMASTRVDEGMPVFICKDSNVQDGVVINGLETTDEQVKPVEKHLVDVNGRNPLSMWRKG